MAKMIGYMITWTTYGTWLQGDKRGYVKNGRILGENKDLRKSNIFNRRGKAVRLTVQQQEVVRKAIFGEAENAPRFRGDRRGRRKFLILSF